MDEAPPSSEPAARALLGNESAASPPVRGGLVHAAAWLGGLQAVSHGVALVASVAVARWLGPSPYGTYALVTWVLGMVSLFREPGIAPAVATGRLQGRPGLAAAQTVVLGASLFWSAALVVGADVLALALEDEALAFPLRVGSLSLVLWGLGVIPQARLQRAQRFRALAWVGLSQQVVASLVTVVLALQGLGVWALVLPLLVAPLWTLGWWVALCGEFPRISWRLGALAGHRAEAREVFGFRFLLHVARNADDLVVAKLCGQGALGLYSLAYAFLRRPIVLVSAAVAPPLMALLSRQTDNIAQRDAHFVDILVAIARFASPWLFCLASLAQTWVPWVFGAQWQEAVPLFQILLFLGSMQLVSNTLGGAWLALGRTQALFRFTLFSGVVSVAAFLIGALCGGVVGVALGYTMVSAALLVPNLVLTARVCSMDLTGLGGRLVTALADQAAAGALTYWLDTRVLASFSPGVRAVSALGAGLAFYALVLSVFRRRELRLLRTLLPAQRR